MNYKRRRVAFERYDYTGEVRILVKFDETYHYGLEYTNEVLSYFTVQSNTIKEDHPFYPCWINIETPNLNCSPLYLRHWKDYQMGHMCNNELAFYTWKT